MKTPLIIAEFDVPGNILPGFLSRRVNRPVDPLYFQRCIERLSERIVIADAGPAYRLADSQPGENRSELGRSVIAAAVRVKDRALRQHEIAGSHLDGRGDQRGTVIVVHRPADDLACRAVDDGREVNPSFPRRYIGNVTDHFLARGGGGEVAVDQIRDRARRALPGRGRPPRPRLAGHQAQRPHQAADQFSAGRDAPPGELLSDAPVPVGAVRIIKRFPDQQPEPLLSFRGGAVRPRPPLIESRFRHSQPPAHAHNAGSMTPAGGRVSALRVDELIHVAHRGSLAKYAAAFFRNAFSISSSRFLRSSSRSRARSDTCSGGSSSACLSRYARTQFPKEVSLIPSSRATSAIARDVSTTIRAASSRNSGE